MKTLTPKEANAIVAEKVHGWVLAHRGYITSYVPKGKEDDHSVSGVTPRSFTPYGNNDQAIAALEEWLLQHSYRDCIIFSCREGDTFGHEVQLVSEKTFQHPRCEDKKLSAAITTALCSAELGEPVEIKDLLRQA